MRNSSGLASTAPMPGTENRILNAATR